MSAPSTEPTFGSHLAMQLDMPNRMISALAADFTEEEAKQSANGLKPLVWYLAHVAMTKNYFLTLYHDAPLELPEDYATQFGRGSDGSADFSGAPSKAELLEQLATIHDRARDLVSGLTPADTTRAAGVETGHPIFKTLGSALTLVVAHDAYHAGQIAQLRRAMGKDPIFG